MDPQQIVYGAIQLVVILFAVSFHEAAHAWAAFKLGDRTAKDAGRLTLNPLSHIDIFGSIIFPVILVAVGSRVVFGWAKPVPVQAFNLRNPRRDMALVGGAGPLSNLLLAGASLLALLFIKAAVGDGFRLLLMDVVSRSVAGGPLGLLVALLFFSFLINTVLGIFNLIPVPPLDGSQLLMAVLPPRVAANFGLLGSSSIGLLLVYFLLVAGLLDRLARPLVVLGVRLLLG